YCTVELRIAGMRNALTIFFVQAFETTGSSSEHNVALFLSRRGNWNIRRNAFLMDHFMAGSIILGGGEPEGRTVGKRQDTLNRTFAKSLFAQNDRPLHILETAGDNLRGAGAVDINEQDYRHAV